MGEENIEKAEISIWESVRWAEIIMGTMGLVFILLPEFILSFFTNNPEVIHLGVFGLRILGLLQFIDAIGFTLWFALSGAGNTFFPAVVESALVWLLLLPVSYITGIILGYGFYGPWLVFPAYLIIFALVLYIKIRKGDWKDIKV
jgi:Na+-driven multidrug efflux pump